MRAMIEPTAAALIDAPIPRRLEQRAKPELLHRPQSHVLAADRAWANQFQGVDVDVLDVAPPARRRGGGADALVGEQLGGDALGVRFQRRRAIGGKES